ncbi:hypothetical protein DFH29DRAFT_1009607 [Suillus ampliporus]|nr:hypothetical protein DFH29DRAFT_1009607 [Suillus ampliporus]
MLPAPPPPTSNGKLTAFVSRRSGQAIKPMEKICEAVNSAPAKQPAPATPEDDYDDDEPPSDNKGDEGKEEEEAYERTKALGDEDRERRKQMKKDECSADFKTIFMQEKGHINPHTQEHEDGWWCEICNPEPMMYHPANVFLKAVSQPAASISLTIQSATSLSTETGARNEESRCTMWVQQIE